MVHCGSTQEHMEVSVLLRIQVFILSPYKLFCRTVFSLNRGFYCLLLSYATDLRGLPFFKIIIQVPRFFLFIKTCPWSHIADGCSAGLTQHTHTSLR